MTDIVIYTVLLKMCIRDRLNTLYRTLEVSEASEEVLEQFESVYERYLTLGQMGQEIKEMMIRQRNIAFHRSRLKDVYKRQG